MDSKDWGKSFKITQLLCQEVAGIYSTRTVPHWVRQYTALETINTILQGCREVLARLDAGSIYFDDIDVSDLTPFWSRHLRMHCKDSILHAPEVSTLIRETISEITKAFLASHSHRQRRRKIIEQGPPPGLDQYPELPQENLKCIEVPMMMYRKHASESGHSQGYADYIQQLSSGRRRPSARSSSHLDDIDHPGLFY